MATCPKCHGHHPDGTERCPEDGEALLSDEAFSGVDPDLEPGHVVGEYQIERKIGEGGFGSVYAALHPLIGKRVAVKVLHREYSSSPQMVSRFIAEARAVNQIRHRNIIDIFSFGVLDDRRQYFVMEYLDGRPFDRYLRERVRLGPEEAIPIFRQIARALDAAHTAGIAHRDLKPENVFLVFDEDGVPFPKLLDFGVAKLLGDSRQGGHRTRTGQPIGTPYYMAPEQCLGEGVDHRADIYAFGVMTHEVLTGKLPFYAEATMQVMVMQMSEEPPPMSRIYPGLPAELDAPVLCMLDKDPAKRPASATAAVEALASVARAAGFDVPELPRKRSGASTPAEIVRAATTPAAGQASGEQPTMGEAQTVEFAVPVRPAAATPPGAALPTGGGARPEGAPAERGRRGRGAILGLAAILALAGVLALVLLGRGRREAPPSSATATVPAARSATPTAAAPASSAPRPAQVRLSIKSDPAEVEVYRGDTRLGRSPGPIFVERGEAPIALTFTAAGYRAKTVDVVPSADVLIQVSLERAPGPKPGPTRPPAASPSSRREYEL